MGADTDTEAPHATSAEVSALRVQVAELEALVAPLAPLAEVLPYLPLLRALADRPAVRLMMKVGPRG